MNDEMRVRVEDYMPEDIEFDLPSCDFCDDRGCEECAPDDFAQLSLKWTCDGTASIDDAIDALNDFIKDLREYQADGFELGEPVDSGHFWLERVNGKTDQSSSSENDTFPEGDGA